MSIILLEPNKPAASNVVCTPQCIGMDAEAGDAKLQTIEYDPEFVRVSVFRPIEVSGYDG
jgi:hypothetical protein